MPAWQKHGLNCLLKNPSTLNKAFKYNRLAIQNLPSSSPCPIRDIVNSNCGDKIRGTPFKTTILNLTGEETREFSEKIGFPPDFLAQYHHFMLISVLSRREENY